MLETVLLIGMLAFAAGAYLTDTCQGPAGLTRPDGIDYRNSLYDGDRTVPITDMGQPIAELFS